MILKNYRNVLARQLLTDEPTDTPTLARVTSRGMRSSTIPELPSAAPHLSKLNKISGSTESDYPLKVCHYSFEIRFCVRGGSWAYPPIMDAPTMTRYVRYEEISFVCPSGVGYQEEAAMMRRARTEIENGMLRQHEQVELVEVWGSDAHRPRLRRGAAAESVYKHLTLYWYRVTITGSEAGAHERR